MYDTGYLASADYPDKLASNNAWKIKGIAMDRFARILALHKIFSGAKVPISGKQIEEKLGCSEATRKRDIEELRNHLNAPIAYDRERNGFYYDLNAVEGGMFELPGLWFNATELCALLVMRELLKQLQPGLFEAQLSPIANSIDKLMKDAKVDGDQAAQRVRIHGMAMRDPGEHFETVAGATIGRQRVYLEYHKRSRDEHSEREISPQRMIHYRDNWNLDAWCHLRYKLRTFAVEQITSARALNKKAKAISDKQLDAHYAGAYGIFAGPPNQLALLRFTPERAAWVVKEQWHPEQQSEWLADGRYELRIPYSDPTELVMDILRHGPEVEVIGPGELRSRVVAQLERTLTSYGDG